jgi:hypothetical protein
MNALCRVPLLLSLLALSAGAPLPPAAQDARAAFERIKALDGDWDTFSSRGWAGEVTYRVIARGSAVLAVSRFEEAHPGETMATVYHLDGDRLMLTHYCVARNQPRLIATAIGGGGSSITFTFRDATNLPSRDRGHMDSVVYRFETPDRFHSRWSFSTGGKESWMEEIRHVRKSAATSPATLPN